MAKEHGLMIMIGGSPSKKSGGDSYSKGGDSADSADDGSDGTDSDGAKTEAAKALMKALRNNDVEGVKESLDAYWAAC